MLIRVLPFLLLLLSVLSSCSEKERGTYRNAGIDTEVREQIDELDQTVLKLLRDGDANALKAFMSEDLKKSIGNTLEGFIETAQRTIDSKQYEVVDRYHRINASVPETVALISGTEHPDDYIIQYQAIDEESVVSIIAPKREGDRYLLTTFYGLKEDGWKINIIQYGRYTIGGLSAIQLYRDAEAQYDQGNVINAINRMVLATGCMQPAGDFWQFRLESDLNAFNQSLSTVADSLYPLPMKVEELPTTPTIFSIVPQRVDNEICTMIKYKSVISIKDTTALAAENKALHELARKHFQGIDEDVPFLFYRAFNELPEGEVATPYFGFVRPLDERLL